jgi:dienelactone hydrolase
MSRNLRRAAAALAWVLSAVAAAADAPTGSGPYPAIREAAPGLPGFTIYRPRDLAQAGRLPIVVWGNGSCRNVGNAYPEFHSELASHGYLVVALGPVVEGYEPPRAVRPDAATPPARPATTPPARGPNETQAGQLLVAIDWALAENARPGGTFFGRLDAERVAASGHSCGGLQALWAGAHDERIDTLVIGNSGSFNPPVLEIPVVHEDLARLTLPIIYLMGGPTDIAYPQAEQDFAAFTTAPVFKANLAVGHGGTYQERNGGEFARVAVAWLDWRLKGAAGAAALFRGEECGLCRDPDWVVERKNLR